MNRSTTKLLSITFVTIYLILATVPLSYSAGYTIGKTLILYYSLTGNTRACCEALQKALGADILEIKAIRFNP